MCVRACVRVCVGRGVCAVSDAVVCRRPLWGVAGKTSYQGNEKADESAICSGLSAGHGIVANVRCVAYYVARLVAACRGGSAAHCPALRFVPSLVN